jgi:hypothetical protein
MAFGKFGTYKKVEILIDAVEIIRISSDEAIEIVIAGTDSHNTSGYLQQVKEKYADVPGIYSPVTLRKIKSQLFLTKVRWWYFPYTFTTGSSGVLHQASYGSSSNARRSEGRSVTGEFFNPKYRVSAEAIKRF